MKGKGYFMRERRLTALVVLCAVVAATLLISTQFMSAQNGKGKEGKGNDKDQPPPFYNPYPPGILPADLNSEIARVLREVDNIEFEALAQLGALPPPTLTNQPPVLAHTGQRLNVLLGKVMNFDKNISPFKNRACGFCHMPYAGFSGPHRDTPIHPVSPYSITMTPSKRFLAETSGIRERPAIGLEVPTKNRRRALRSIRKNTRCRTRLASRSGFRPRCISLSLSKYGAMP